MSSEKFLFIFYLSITICQMSAGDFVLFDDRIDSQQKTEIRYDVPDGCVVTGLGFRAAYDNITTMHCRYHRLAADGKLVEPKEVHLGSEPEHSCEAKVLLPDGWVAVGFGAAGEPEWDVTLLRIWARRLNADGSLGEMKTYSAGFKPDRGCEREIITDEPDRVMVGAGLRFHQNNIGGIYARSKRILNLDDKAQERLHCFNTRGWVVSSLAYKDLSRLRKDVKSHSLNRLDIVYPRELSAFPSADNLKSFVWFDTTNFTNIQQALADAPDFTGIVLDLAKLPPPDQEANVLVNLLKACQTKNLQISLRLDHRKNPLSPKNIQLVRSIPKDVGLIVPLYDKRIFKQGASLPDFDAFGPRDVIIEFDLIRQSMGQSKIPDVRIDELPALITEAALAGAKGFIVQVNLIDGELLDGINSLSLQALHRLADDPFQPTDPLWRQFCKSKYGPAADHALRALKRTAAINNLIYRTFDYPMLWYNGTMQPLGAVDARIKHFMQNSSSPQTSAILGNLLEPTDTTLGRAIQEKETALWLLQQSIADASKAEKAYPSPETRALSDAMQKLQTVALFWQDVTRAYCLTKLYAIDGAPVTRANVMQALKSPGKTADSEMLTQKLRSNGLVPLCVGCSGFVRTLQDSLEYSEKHASLPLALGGVRSLSEQGQNDEAANELRQIILSPKFSPHLGKQNKMIDEITSSLKSFGDLTPNLRVLRGGDGSWTIEKIRGRWCWVLGQKAPCLYLGTAGGPLDPPADYVVSFEYLDKGDWKIYFNYDSNYPPAQKREYHPVEPLQLTNTGAWKNGSFVLTNCRFASSQNNGADMRFVSGKGACIRNIRLERK